MPPTPEEDPVESLAVDDLGDIATGARFGCDQWPLHYACRTGNLEHVKYLVNVLKMPLDEQDSHDATPLYLAALTGRNDICQFLLQSGAKCDPDSGGDAARVFYVALTPELRKLLREWSLTAASRDPFLDVLRKAFNDRTHADTVCHMRGQSIYLHRLILQARCPCLTDRIIFVENDLNELRLTPDHLSNSSVLIKLFLYLYTGEFETLNVENALVAQQLAKEFHLPSLFQRLDAALARYMTKSDGLHSDVSRFKWDMSDLSLVKEDMARVAALASTPHNLVDTIERLNLLVEWSDTTVKCDDHTWSLHSFLLCGQSEYFKCALEGGFRESRECVVDLSHLLPCPEALRMVIQWLYADQFLEDEPIRSNLELAVWLLEMGSAILCPRLISYTTNTILIPAVDEENVFDLFQLSKMHSLDKLEDKCVQVMAWNLESLASRYEMHDIIVQEASQIIQGGDIRVTDVPIAAEMKSAISKQDGLSRERRTRLLQMVQEVVEDVLGSSS